MRAPGVVGRKVAFVAISFLVLAQGIGCHSGTDKPGGAGGTSGSGNAGGTSGTGGSGGAGATSGTAGAGGTNGTAGSGAKGGAGGAGGASGTAGSGARGGSGGTAGSTGAGGSGGSCAAGAATGSGGSGQPEPNCAGLASICGAASDENCCGSTLVPGGTFNRSNDAASPATVSDFVLDTFEVSVGRFRSFIDSGRGTQMNPPAAGAGAHPLIPGTGWDSAWNTNLATDPAAWKCALQGLPLLTWSDSGANDRLPMNYVTWFEAFAFCIWDGGRLPTEAEWNYAAAGGTEQRKYPWGDADPDATRESTGCMTSVCSAASIVPVGSKPAGNGRWGHAEMAGNLIEWTFDWLPTTVYKNPCVDCAETTMGAYRVQRGGDYYFAASTTTLYRSYWTPSERKVTFGFRCARAKP